MRWYGVLLTGARRLLRPLVSRAETESYVREQGLTLIALGLRSQHRSTLRCNSRLEEMVIEWCTDLSKLSCTGTVGEPLAGSMVQDWNLAPVALVVGSLWASH